jgi:hypothetical protein
MHCRRVILDLGMYRAQTAADDRLCRIQPHFPCRIEDLEIATFQQVTCGFLGWGGWDSNPGPADYESSPPAVLVRASDLGGYVRARSCSSPFGHVLGTIKPGFDANA